MTSQGTERPRRQSWPWNWRACLASGLSLGCSFRLVALGQGKDRCLCWNELRGQRCNKYEVQGTTPPQEQSSAAPPIRRLRETNSSVHGIALAVIRPFIRSVHRGVSHGRDPSITAAIAAGHPNQAGTRYLAVHRKNSGGPPVAIKVCAQQARAAAPLLTLSYATLRTTSRSSPVWFACACATLRTTTPAAAPPLATPLMLSCICHIAHHQPCHDGAQ